MYETDLEHPHRRIGPFERSLDVLAAASRYDLVLGIVPLAFALAVVGANVLDTSTTAALFVAALVGATAIVDAVYLNPPVDPSA